MARKLPFQKGLCLSQCHSAKARLGKRPIFNKQDMKRHLLSILRSIQKQTALVKSFFRMPHTKYILDATA